MSNFTPLTDGMDANAANFNAPLQELSDAIDGRAAAQHAHTSTATGGRLTPDALDTTGANEGDVPTVQADASVAWAGFRVVPTGAMMPYAAAVAPAGWLLCDGSAVSRTTYASLFAVIGTTFGSGDGATTFNLPDMRGRVPGGLDNMGGTSANTVTDTQADTLGGTAGSETHTLIDSEVPVMNAIVQRGSNLGGTAIAGSFTGGTTDDIATNRINPGGGGAHNNMQPTLFVNFIIAT